MTDILKESNLEELGFTKRMMPGTGYTSISSMTPAIYYYENGSIGINATEIWTWFLNGEQRNDIAVNTKQDIIYLLKKHNP